jgi:hypothetical protein
MNDKLVDELRKKNPFSVHIINYGNSVCMYDRKVGWEECCDCLEEMLKEKVKK